MTTLLLKDLRLSLDVLRPWAIMVFGLAIGLGILTALPSTVSPVDLRDMRAADILVTLAVTIAASAVAVGAWLATSIVQGDQKHGAGSMAVVLPSSAARRVGAKLVALALAITPIPLAAFVALSIAALLNTERTLGYWRGFGVHGAAVSLGGLAAAVVAAGLGSFVAQTVRGAFAAVALSLLGFLLAVAVGGLGAWACLFAFHHDLVEVGSLHPASVAFQGVRTLTLTSGAIAGAGVAGAGALLAATIALARPRSSRWMVGTGAAITGIAFLAGGAVGQPVLAYSTTVAMWSDYQVEMARRLTPQELAKRQLEVAPPIPPGSPDAPARERIRLGVMGAAYRYRRELPESRLATDPVEAACRSLEDFSSPAEAVASCSLMSVHDPRWLPTVLDAVAADPLGTAVNGLVWGGAQRGTLISNDAMARLKRRCDGVSSRAEVDSCLQAVLDDELTRHIREGHPERERMQRAIDALRRAAARLDPPPAPEPTP